MVQLTERHRAGGSRRPGSNRARRAARSKAVGRTHPGDPAPGALNENLGALGVELTPDDLGRSVRRSKDQVQGGRYPEHLERMTYL